MSHQPIPLNDFYWLTGEKVIWIISVEAMDVILMKLFTGKINGDVKVERRTGVSLNDNSVLLVVLENITNVYIIDTEKNHMVN